VNIRTSLRALAAAGVVSLGLTFGSAVAAGAAPSPTSVGFTVVSAAAGVPVTLTANVFPQVPPTAQITGTATFMENGVAVPACTNVTVSAAGEGDEGTASCTITFASPGSYSFVVDYSGDANWSGSDSATATENVLEPATVSATATPHAPVEGQGVTLAATVSGAHGTPTGQVMFTQGPGTDLCVADLVAGSGSCSYAFETPGTQTVQADYLGDATYADSDGSNSFGSASVVVSQVQTSTTISGQQIPWTSGVPAGASAFAVAYTATVTAQGSAGRDLAGAITFTIDGQPIAAPGCVDISVSGPSPQQLTCTDNNPDDFGAPVVAGYSQDSQYAASTSAPVTVPSTPDPTTIYSVGVSPTAPVAGQTVDLSAQINGYITPVDGPEGYVAFTVGDVLLCAAPVESDFTAACQTSAFPSGVDSFTVTYVDPFGAYGSASKTVSLTVAGTLSPVVGMAATPDGQGYWIVRADGAVSAFGDAGDYGSMYGQSLNRPIVGMAVTPDGGGYWLVATDGGIFSFGDATFYGSTGSLHLNKPIVGMTATPDGRGYYFVASDGGIFAYGDAGFAGSMGGQPLNQPIVGMALDGATGGYWLVAADGGIFSFNAPFDGSTGSLHLNKPIVGMEAAPDGSGYRFVASDGGIFSFGLPFEGSTGSLHLNRPIVGMAATGSLGYWLVASDGGVFSFNAPFLGAAT
jgi:Bacterial Ig-like domain (group 3)